MFWRKKHKLPVTPADQAWVNDSLDWLKNEFGHDHFMTLSTLNPFDFDRSFDGSSEDAEFVLEKLVKLMDITTENIKLNFFFDGAATTDDGNILTTPASADIKGRWKGASGTYQSNSDGFTISLEMDQLENPASLIATLAHELAHEKLLGEGRIKENDEYLTDLTAIYFGYGVFMGNSRFQFNQFSTHTGSGWESSSQGYLPEQIIAYAMAKMAVDRNENTDYTQYLKPTLKKYFDQSMTWLNNQI